MEPNVYNKQVYKEWQVYEIKVTSVRADTLKVLGKSVGG